MTIASLANRLEDRSAYLFQSAEMLRRQPDLEQWVVYLETFSASYTSNAQLLRGQPDHQALLTMVADLMGLSTNCAQYARWLFDQPGQQWWASSFHYLSMLNACDARSLLAHAASPPFVHHRLALSRHEIRVTHGKKTRSHSPR